jgi:hypothetical protein
MIDERSNVNLSGSMDDGIRSRYYTCFSVKKEHDTVYLLVRMPLDPLKSQSHFPQYMPSDF